MTHSIYPGTGVEPPSAWMRRIPITLSLIVLVACSSESSNKNAKAPDKLVPDADAPPITAVEGTPLHHAQTCAQYLGPIPAMSCADAALMPITVDGVEVFETPPRCDRPSALTGTCETGERIAAKYIGTHHDGSPRPEVVFINFCRDGGMGVIGYNSETGATCFFHISQRYSNMVRHPGSDDPDYDEYWQNAREVAADNCQGCHQADPWLHSPWIDQLKDPDEPSKTLVPVLEGKAPPYVVVGDGFSQPFHDGAPQNSCTSCHRPQCDNGFAVPLGQLVMPGPFADSTYHSQVSDDLQAMRDWCASLPNGGVGGPDHSGDDQNSECDDFVRCYTLCSDYGCAESCASAYLEDDLLVRTEALLSCMKGAGCLIGDDACISESCPSEAEVFYEGCGYR